MWFVARTKPRFEKKVELLLNALSVEGNMHPLVADALVLKVKRKWSDRTKIVELPSVSGYVFVRFNGELSDKTRTLLLTKIHYTPGILRLLANPGRSSFDVNGLARVPQRELDIFRAAAEVSGDSITAVEDPADQITTGSTVRFTTGPLAELNATFTVDNMQQDTPTLFINEGIFKNARFTVSKELLEIVK